MAQALGVRFGRRTIRNCLLAESRLKNWFEWTKRQMSPLLDKATFSIACDVSCPVDRKERRKHRLGSAQKAPIETEVKLLDNALCSLCRHRCSRIEKRFWSRGCRQALGFAMTALFKCRCQIQALMVVIPMLGGGGKVI